MIRSFQPGDEAYVVRSHSEIYSKEYGFDETFREFVADAVEEFGKNFDSETENLWIVEINGEPKGSIGITRGTDSQAQLRWLLVEPDLRGLGYGKRLLETAIRFCEEKKYERIFLWTNSRLTKARELYLEYGFHIAETKEQVLSGQLLVEERWEKILEMG